MSESVGVEVDVSARAITTESVSTMIIIEYSPTSVSNNVLVIVFVETLLDF